MSPAPARATRKPAPVLDTGIEPMLQIEERTPSTSKGLDSAKPEAAATAVAQGFGISPNVLERTHVKAPINRHG